jgi:hypothetical protein
MGYSSFIILPVLVFSFYIFLVVGTLVESFNLQKINQNFPWVKNIYRHFVFVTFEVLLIPSLSVLLTTVHCVDGHLINNLEVECWNSVVHVVIAVISIVFFIVFSVHYILYEYFIHPFIMRLGGANSYFSHSYSLLYTCYLVMMVFLLFMQL